MKTELYVIAESDKAYKIRTYTGIYSYQDKYQWIPKSVCTTKEYFIKRDYLTGNDIYRTVITSVEDWYYYKYL